MILTFLAALSGTLVAHVIMLAVGVAIARRDRKRREAALANIQAEAQAMLDSPFMRALRQQADAAGQAAIQAVKDRERGH